MPVFYVTFYVGHIVFTRHAAVSPEICNPDDPEPFIPKMLQDMLPAIESEYIKLSGELISLTVEDMNVLTYGVVSPSGIYSGVEKDDTYKESIESSTVLM